jgi:hypothetical protein
MTAPAEQALKLQRPLPNDVLKIVATGEKEDGAVAELRNLASPGVRVSG